MRSITKELLDKWEAADAENKLLRKQLEIEQECVNRLHEALWQIACSPLPHGNLSNHIDFLRKVARLALHEQQQGNQKKKR